MMTRMKWVRRVLLLAAVFLLFISAAAAFVSGAGDRELFTEPPQDLALRQGEPPEGPEVMRSRYAGVDLNAANNLQAGQSLVLRLFDDVIYTFIIDEVMSDGSQAKITGHIQDVNYSLAVMVAGDGRLVMDVFMPGGIYQVRRLGNGLYKIYQIDQ